MVRKTSTRNNGADSTSQNGNDGNQSIADGDVITASGIDTVNDGESDRVINPGDLISGEPDPGDSGGRKRRGRPRGSGTGSGKSSRKEVSEDLAAVLFSLHFMAEKFLKVEELQISEEESKRLSDAILRVNNLYGGLVIPEKTMAIINLATVATGIYAPRVIAHGLRKKQEKKQTINATPPIRVT